MIGEIGGEDINHNVVKSTCRLDVYEAVRQSSGASESNHKFVGALGHTSEDNTGLIYMRARYHDPSIGRFISEDPAKDGVNWYAYCLNNSVNLTDESGEVAGEEGLVAEVVAASAAVGAGGALIQRIEMTMWAWGAQIIAALEGAENVIVKAIPGRGVIITNGVRQVFIDLCTHPNEPHFDVQSKTAGWDAMWKILYAEINHLRF